MKCPNCGSLRVVFMGEDKNNCDGKTYSHECLKCGTMITREEFEKSWKPGYKIDKEVLME